jgi:hypothetical protein
MTKPAIPPNSRWKRKVSPHASGIVLKALIAWPPGDFLLVDSGNRVGAAAVIGGELFSGGVPLSSQHFRPSTCRIDWRVPRTADVVC